ncbi:MAG: hypothetical protein NTW51_15525 [Cyanobacteria bacterium]|nr:hypothetical protein [Cyanobacteriota bacterium]
MPSRAAAAARPGRLCVARGLAGLRRPAAAGEITASGPGLSLDIGVNGQVVVGGRGGAGVWASGGGTSDGWEPAGSGALEVAGSLAAWGKAPGAEGASTRMERNLGGLAGGWSQQTRRQRRGGGGWNLCPASLVFSGS